MRKKQPPTPTSTLHPAPPKKNTRAQQSRINGANSKGPNSPAGKLRSSRNALRHGLTASIHTVLYYESNELCHEVEDAWLDDLRPATKAELRLVQQVANINWRLERLAMMETALLNIEMAVHLSAAKSQIVSIDDIGILGAAWKASADSSHGLDLLRRYLATLQNQFNGTLKNFRSLETARKHPSNIRDSAFFGPYQKPVFQHADQNSGDTPPNPNKPDLQLDISENTPDRPLSGSPKSPGSPKLISQDLESK